MLGSYHPVWQDSRERYMNIVDFSIGVQHGSSATAMAMMVYRRLECRRNTLRKSQCIEREALYQNIGPIST